MQPCLDFGAADEVSLYHDTSRFGFFSVLYKNGDRKYQRSHPLLQMPQVIQLLPRDRDTWISQAEFIKPNRQLVNLARIELSFVDLDCYDREPNFAVSELLFHCEEAGVPFPSIVVFSGRGLQAKWIYDRPIPRFALPRWNSIQSSLGQAFAIMGSDPNAKDASRVLRLVNTVNTKSGEVARVIHTTKSPDGQPVTYAFEYLAECTLKSLRDDSDEKHNNHPYTPEEQAEIAIAREQRQANYDVRQARKQLRLIEGGADTSGLRSFSGRQLAWHRMEDLRTLVRIRGGVTGGQSMAMLFWTLNFLLLSGAVNSGNLFNEAGELCQEYGFGSLRRSDELVTLYRKAREFESGKKVTYNGVEYPPLYTPKNSKLISLFHITDAEQRQLRTIISADMARERDAQRHAERRREAGAMTREEYLTMNDDKRTSARLLKAQGLSNRAIAAQLGVSKDSVRLWCSIGG